MKFFVLIGVCLGAAMSSAMAATVEFAGTFHFANLPQACLDLGYKNGAVYLMRFRPPNLGTNGPSTRLTILSGNNTNNILLKNGTLVGKTFKTVTATSIGGGAGSESTTARFTKQVPAVPDDTTKTITIAGDWTNFEFEPSCAISFVATGFKP